MTARSVVRGPPAPEGKSDSSQAIAMYAASMSTSTTARTGSNRTAPVAICTAAACEPLHVYPLTKYAGGGHLAIEPEPGAGGLLWVRVHKGCGIGPGLLLCGAHRRPTRGPPSAWLHLFYVFYLHISFGTIRRCLVACSKPTRVANTHR